MAFLLSDERDRPHAHRRYLRYLESVRAQFPPGAWALATSDWYFAFGDHRCPHDAWLEELTLSEPATGARDEARHVSVRIRLKGAFHDGHIELFYARVFGYAFGLRDARKGHGDWRYDEFRLSENGYLLHEIEWSSAGMQTRWLIEASDVQWRWLPLVTA